MANRALLRIELLAVWRTSVNTFAVSFSGTGVFDAYADTVEPIEFATTFAGAGDIAATADIDFPLLASVSFTGDGTLAADVDISLVFNLAVDFVGDADLDAHANITVSLAMLAVTFAGSGDITRIAQYGTLNIFIELEGEDSSPTVGGELGALDNLYAVHSLKRVLSSYDEGPLVRLRRSSDNVELDFARSIIDNWVDAGAILAWLAGAQPFVKTLYDQTGNLRHATQATASLQPLLNMTQEHPSVHFDGVNDFLPITSATAFAQNQPACSLIHVRKHDIVGPTQFAMFVSNNAAGSRMALHKSGTHRASGRRLDGNTGQQTAGFLSNTDWGVDIGRWDWATAKLSHQLDASAELYDPFQTAGNTSDTASASLGYGGVASASSPFNGRMTLGALVRDRLTDQEVTALLSSLSQLKLSGAAPVVASLAAPRLSGPAPFATMLDATASTAVGITNPLKDLEHTFGTGESGTGNWAVEGVPATAKNAYVGGPLMPHCWQTPGTYVVSHQARNRVTSEIGTSTPITITVTDPNTVWPTTNTICVSPTADYTGAPAGSVQQTTMPTVFTGKRVLLHKGETFGNFTIPQATINCLVGAYGTGARPIVSAGAGNTSIFIGPSAAPAAGQWPENIVIAGLNCAGKIVQRTTCKRLTLHDNIYDAFIFADAFDFNLDSHGSTLVPFYPQEIFASHDFARSTLTGGESNICTGIGSYLGFIGVDYGIANQHTIRIYRHHKMGIRASAIRGQSNPVSGISPSQSLKAHSGGALVYNDSTAVVHWGWGSKWAVAGGCLFGDTADLGQYTVSFGPQNNLSDERVENVLIQDSIFREGTNCVREVNFAVKNGIERSNVRAAGGAFRTGVDGEQALPPGHILHYFLS